MKKTEKNIADGWTIFPPEHAPKAERWIKAAEAVPETAHPPRTPPPGQHREHEENIKW